MKRALFLDRDGTINIDYHYIRDPELVDLFPGAAAAIKRANDAGWFVGVVTNQSGVGRGLIKSGELEAVHARLAEKLAAVGARIDSYEICVHAPSEDCECRKPLPKLIMDAAAREGLDLARSVMVGDRLTDVAAGRGAGCKSVLVRTGNGREEELLLRLAKETPGLEQPDFVAEDLVEAVEWALREV